MNNIQMRCGFLILAVLLVSMSCTTFSFSGGTPAKLVFVAKYTTASGLAADNVDSIAMDGSLIAAGSNAGVSISRDGGQTWAVFTATDGLGDDIVLDVSVSGSTVLAGTRNGLSISLDAGETWRNYTTADGLCGDYVTAVFAVGSAYYAGTNGRGLSLSKDGGATWTTYASGNTQKDGFWDLYAQGQSVYAATEVGVLISRDGGSTWKTYLKSNGLGDNEVHSIFVDGSRIYAGTYKGLSISSNGGSSWSNSYPQGVNKLAPDWHDTVSSVSVIGSTIFAGGSFLEESANGGGSWTEVDGELENVNIAGIVSDGKNLYLATNKGVFIYRVDVGE